MEEKVLNFEWLEGKLNAELEAIAEDLENGGKISATDFARLVEFHLELQKDMEPEESTAEWRE